MSGPGSNSELDRIFRRLTGAAVFVLDPTWEGDLNRSADDAGFRIFRINAEGVNSKQELLSAFADEFRFPDYFGKNWDALSECIRDLSWLPRGNFVLALRNAGRLLGLGANDFAVLVGILGDATFSWKADGVTFSVVLLGGTEVVRGLETALRDRG